MKILDSALVKDHYDVIVVGAGNGGLTTAALLAKRGLKVLVVEQHYIPGGCVTAIRRHDTAMDVGAAILFGWGEEGLNPQRFVMNELEEEIDMIQHEAVMRMHLLGKKVNFSRDMDVFLDELSAVFPHQDKAIRDLYKDFTAFYEGLSMTSEVMAPPTEISAKEGLRAFLKNPVNCMKMGGFMLKTEEDVIGKYVTDPKLMGFFDVVTMFYTTCNVTESPALLGATMFIDNHVGGSCYPSGSPQMLPNTLEKSIERNGGQIIYRQLVDEILIFKGKAYGVRLDDGTEIMADRVVSNADVYSLYGTLIKSRHIKPKRIKWAQNLEPTVKPVLLYMVVKEEAIPENTEPIEVFVDDSFSIDNTLGVFVPALEDPTVAPPGYHSMTVIAPNKLKWPRPDDRFYQTEEYTKMKEDFADTVIDRLEKQHFSNLRENIVSMDIGTPATTERYTRKVGGHIGGPKLSMKQNFFVRLKARSEWKNLYCTGDSTSTGEGVVATCMSGIGAANMVLQDVGLPEYKPREYSKQYVNILKKGQPWTKTPDPTEPITEESAKRIGRDCQHCQDPECRNACPANIDTCSFARRIETGNFRGAARVIREVNPLSEICGFICPAERFCEKKCNRLDFDDKPVRIRELHGWVCGHVSKEEGWDRSVPKPNGRKVAVVGAGPAGLSCGHYLARLGYKVDIIDKADKPGGMMSHTVPAFRLSDEVINRDIDGLTVPGLNFQFSQTLGKDVTVENLEKDYDAVFLALGLGTGRMVEVSGLEKSKATDAISLLTAFRKTGKAKVGKKVLVIGGGSVAADAAMVARESGAAEVVMACLEKEDEMPALAQEVTELKKEGVTILNGWAPKASLEGNKLSFIGCTSVFDNEGQFSPSYDESQTMEVAFDQVIMAVGQTLSPVLAKYLKKEFKKDGLLEVDHDTMLVKGRAAVYAGGDIIRGAGTVVEAVGDGRRAAVAIHAQLSKPQ